MKKSLFMFAALFASCLAFAAPPYTVQATATAAATGDPATHYILYADNVAMPASTECAADPVICGAGNTLLGVNNFVDFLTADGTYVFELGAVNAHSEVRSAPITVTVSEIGAPGQPTLEIQINCDPCILQIN